MFNKLILSCLFCSVCFGQSNQQTFNECTSGPDKQIQWGVTSECAIFHDFNKDGSIDLRDFVETQKLSVSRHAGQPDSWLVLYNLNSADSIEWKNWYLSQWNIPEENALGLDASLSERITLTQFQQTIYQPVQVFLINNPKVRQKIMGILVGYRVPGNFINGADPMLPGGGGYSVSNYLIDLSSSSLFMTRNYHMYAFYSKSHIAPERLTKKTIGANLYITARIDAPSLNEAKELTIRAKKIVSGETLINNSFIHYDFSDQGAPAGNDWQALEKSISNYDLTIGERYPWREWDSENFAARDSLLEFSYYRVAGWQNIDWDCSGPRVLGYAFNSWGCTTLRSTTNHNGRYVPNLLFQGGYCSGIGATAEPYSNTGPSPHMIVWCLQDGRTVAEALFHSQTRTKWMWELVGDPLLYIPNWFN